ncbi:OTU domain-containing protein, partial [Durusdinium trenchii]
RATPLIWNGTPGDDAVLTTLYEGDSKHGGNMQASLLFMNFHRKVVATGVVPESLVISADNTPKETKNAMVFTWMVWLLCCLRETRLWRVRTVYKLVGHTHSHCDRLFSRVKASLMGKSYISEDDVMNIIVATLKSYTLDWNHLHASLNFEELNLGLEIHALRNVHDLEVFRTNGGIYVRWKQYLSGELWSRPRLVVAAENMATVATAMARPPHIRHCFSQDMKTKFHDFLGRVEVQLGSMNLLDDRVKAGVAWLNNDVLLFNCPGADMPGMLLENLVRLGGTVQDEPAIEIMCVTGDFVIVDNTSSSKALPFCLGEVIDIDEDSAIIQWWHPGKSKEANLKAGRKKAILDLFGEWAPTDDLPLTELEPLPPSILSPSKILIWGFNLESGQVPFEILDKVMDLDFVDLTGLKLSSTKRGSLYRAHRLMRT